MTNNVLPFSRYKIESFLYNCKNISDFVFFLDEFAPIIRSRCKTKLIGGKHFALHCFNSSLCSFLLKLILFCPFSPQSLSVNIKRKITAAVFILVTWREFQSVWLKTSELFKDCRYFGSSIFSNSNLILAEYNVIKYVTKFPITSLDVCNVLATKETLQDNFKCYQKSKKGAITHPHIQIWSMNAAKVRLLLTF